MTINNLFKAIFSLAAVVALVSLVEIVRLNGLSNETLDVSGYRFEAYKIGQEVTIDSDELTRLARTYVVTLNPSFKADYFSLVDKIEGKAPRPDGNLIAFTDLLNQFNFSASELALLDKSASLSADLIATEEAAFALVEPFENMQPAQLSSSQLADWTKAIDLLHNRAYHAERNKIFAPINTFESDLEKRTSQQFESMAASLKNNIRLLLTSIVLVVLVIGFAYMVMTRRIIRPLTRVVKDVSRLSEGDLLVSFKTRRRDEMGTLLISMQSVVDNLRQAVSAIRNNAENASKTSVSLSRNAEKSRQLCIEQSDQSALSATAVEEMSLSAKNVSGTCTEAITIVECAVSNLAETENSVSQTLSSIDQVSQDVNESLDKLNELTASVEGVSSVVDVINSIAEQTNLLALNAAIEAARAGEQGRGFAVVADEVRSLAQRTQASTSEILETIEQLRQRSGQVKQAMEQSNSLLDKLVENSQSVSGNVGAVTEAMSSIQQVTRQIDTASNEQAFVTSDVGKQVVQISAKAMEIDELSVDVSDKASEIESIAKNLNEAVQFFVE